MGKNDTKEKKQNWFAKHKVLTVIGVLILLVIIGSAVGGGKSNNTSSSTTSSKSTASKASTATAKLNQPASDGKFQFTVTSFSCGQTDITQPGNAYATAQAQGQFCTMNLTVKNIGSVSQVLDANSQYVYDSNNKQYSYSSDGTIMANAAGDEFAEFQTVNPGVTVTGILVFDVPTGTTPVTAMLHDSSASNGVKVDLQ